MRSTSMRLARPLSRMTAICLALVSAACGSAGTSPDSRLSVAGGWLGVAVLPNGRTTSLDLQQIGDGITGTMSVSGAFIKRPVTGQVNATRRSVAWAVANGCELWGGALTLSQDGSQMSGTVVIDRGGCRPVVSNGSGTLSLNRN